MLLYYLQLTNEVPLDVSIICAIDGNQSLKRRRLRDGLEEEPRTFRSSYYISESDVDRFKNDVKTRAPRKVMSSQCCAVSAYEG